MTKVGDPDPARAARFLEDLVDDAEAERIGGLSEEELLAELKAEGKEPLPPVDAPALVARLKARAAERAGTAPTARVAWIRMQPRAWQVAAVAAAAGVVIAGVVASHRDDRVSAPADSQRPDELRKEAFGECAQSKWRECAELLNRAAALDPAGEELEAVKKARAEVARGLGR